MMIISLSWWYHGVTCSCHKLLLSRKLSRGCGCVTCCPIQGLMYTGSDAPLLTQCLSLRMRGWDQQVVARPQPPAPTASQYSYWTHPHTPRPSQVLPLTYEYSNWMLSFNSSLFAILSSSGPDPVQVHSRSILIHSNLFNSKSDDLDQELMLFSLCHHPPPPRKLF